MSENLHYLDITNEQENYTIPLVNSLDSEGLPTNFKYVPRNFLGIEACSEDFGVVAQPCACTNLCQMNSCLCETRYGFGFIESRLKEEFTSLNNVKPVIECSPLCTCDTNCPNRITQHGINYRLRVYKTENKGFAVQTLDEIPKLAYVFDYAGEVISVKEAKRRFSFQKADEPNYIFVLREYCAEKSVIVTVIDPTTSGNVGRFLNHSCSPNLVVVPVRSDNMVPKICFFARRNIAALEELCYDYDTPLLFENDKEALCVNSSTCHVNFRKKCYCLSANCSGYLPFCSDVLVFES